MAQARLGISLLLGTMLAGSVFAAAQAQSNSPFARKKPKAWEQPQTTQPAPTYTQPKTYTPPSQPAPTYTPPSAGTYQAPTYQQPAYQAPKGGTSAGGSYYPGKPPAQTAPVYTQPSQGTAQGTTQGAPYQYPAYRAPQPTSQAGQYQTRQTGLRGAAKPSWASRLGLGNVETDLSGRASLGVAGVDRANDDWGAEFVGDLDIRGEVSAITEGGLEYGAGLRVRAQRDRRRNGFGGRVGDCPAADPACNGVTINGDTRAVKGHTGQFYTDGNADTKDGKIALEGAYLFLRSSYGDVLVGRDDGAAYLFSLGAPSLVSVSASNSRLDYTGLDSVKTYNDASGFSEKIAYTSPRLLGDQIGVGVQVGVSYALDATACGVDYCVKDNTDNALDPFAPEIEDVVELGVALDRNFGNGFSAELTGTYARGSEKTGNALFTDLESYSAGLELKYGDWVFGTSYLNSNNGFAGQGDYSAYDVGLTWQPNAWGFTASYGHADDDIAKVTSDQGVFAVSYDVDGRFGKYRLGTGVQYVSRNVPTITAAGRDASKEDALALFVEAGIKF